MFTGGSDVNHFETRRRALALCAANRFYSRVFHSLQVRQRCPLPRHGAAILVCNHTSSIDPLLLQSTTGRLIRWMMAKEYFQIRPLRLVFANVGVILVERSGRDMAATRAAMRVLSGGGALGVFPEGRIEDTRDLLPFQNGIGLLAMKTGANVFPAYLDGTQRGREMMEPFIHPCRATATFGPKVNLSNLSDDRQGIMEATKRIQSSVEDLKMGGFSA